MTVALKVYDADSHVTLLGTLDQPYDIAWSRERLDVGAGRFTIPHDSPVLVSTPAILNDDNRVVVEIDGVRKFHWLMRRKKRTKGDVWDPIQVAGEGALEIMRSALVYPRGGLDSLFQSDQRVFGWMTPDYDDSVNWTQITGAMVGAGLSTEGWPDDTAVGYEHGHTTQDDVSRVRRLLEGSTGSAGGARMFFAATWKTALVVWLDGEEVARKEAYESGLVTVDMEYREVDQQIAVEIIGGDGRWGFSWVELTGDTDEDGEPIYGSVIRRTYDPADFPSATPWLYWSGTGHPGVTPGFILQTLFNEAEARGFTTAISIDFNADVDSGSTAWPELIEFACQVGNDSWLSVAERLRDYGVDVELDPNLNLSAWQGRGTDRTASITVPLSEAYDVSVEAEGEKINTVLVRTQDEWIERPDPNPSSPRREGFLSLGLTPSAEGGVIVADDILSDFGNARVVFSFATHEDVATYQPSVDYDLGDLILGPSLSSTLSGDWAVGNIKIDSIAAVVDRIGSVEWVHEASLE